MRTSWAVGARDSPRGAERGVAPMLGRPSDVALFGVRGEKYDERADRVRDRAHGAGDIGHKAQKAYEPGEYRKFDHV